MMHVLACSNICMHRYDEQQIENYHLSYNGQRCPNMQMSTVVQPKYVCNVAMYTHILPSPGMCVCVYIYIYIYISSDKASLGVRPMPVFLQLLRLLVVIQLGQPLTLSVVVCFGTN